MKGFHIGMWCALLATTSSLIGCIVDHGFTTFFELVPIAVSFVFLITFWSIFPFDGGQMSTKKDESTFFDTE